MPDLVSIYYASKQKKKKNLTIIDQNDNNVCAICIFLMSSGFLST